VVIAPDDGGLCIALDGVTIGYLRWNARIDLLFAPEVGDRVVAEGLARRDPEPPHKGRVVTDVRTAADVDRTVWLLRLAFLTADLKRQVGFTPPRHRPLLADGRSETPLDSH
jgi:hypothetical protein